MTCLASNPCGEEGFDHKEHTLCNGCKRRVPIGLDAVAILNSTSSCDRCKPFRVPSMYTPDYIDAVSGVGPMAYDWKDKPHRLVYDLAHEVALLKKLLWLRHDPEHFSALYGDDGEMQCGQCLLDFKRMSAEQIEAIWVQAGLRKFIESQKKAEPPKLICQDCGGPDGVEGFCPFASEIHNRDVPVILCRGCSHERAMDI